MILVLSNLLHNLHREGKGREKTSNKAVETSYASRRLATFALYQRLPNLLMFQRVWQPFSSLHLTQNGGNRSILWHFQSGGKGWVLQRRSQT